ncbi:MAG: 3-octaprenyl-4-hydroxybenzoate carboxy-lyase [Bacteroidia bacterium]|nr:MAG: 3-octaprenyl-4-hydroxybenzoate carboxy-lyase [Bacteroidia bacterium]
MKLVIGVGGASGMIYALRLFQKLQQPALESQCSKIVAVFSDNAKNIWQDEIGDKQTIENLPFEIYDNHNFYVPPASGSSTFDTMIIAPCSTGTMSRIACGISDSLIGRIADVMLKERKKLILALREMPLNLIHIRHMASLTEAGGIICPTSPSFYTRPQTVEEVCDTVIDRLLDLAGFTHFSKRWQD